jgi:hypothetical protein
MASLSRMNGHILLALSAKSAKDVGNPPASANGYQKSLVKKRSKPIDLRSVNSECPNFGFRAKIILSLGGFKTT